MSTAREAAFGGLNKNKSIVYNGKEYLFRPVLSEGTLNALEEAVFQKERESLKAIKDLLEPAVFMEEAQKLRKRKAAGEFSFSNPKLWEEKFNTADGAVTLLTALCVNGTEAEIIGIMNQNEDEVSEILNEIVETSFPSPKQ